jgi:hypothetical protein
MPVNRSTVQRKILGVSAVALLLFAAILWCLPHNTEDTISLATLAFCWRMGAVVAAAWLAYDDIQKLPGWILAVLPVLAIVVVRWPRYAMLLIPITIVAAFFYSRFTRR